MVYNVLHKTKLPSNSSEQNRLAIKYQTNCFESLMPEQNRNKPNYIEKKDQNVKTESTLRKQQAREILQVLDSGRICYN